MNIRVGLFDSGIGGFTVLRKVHESYGDIPCVYLADIARLPYGTKKPSEIREIASEVVKWLTNQDLSVILIACNTTNSIALDIVEKFSTVPVFGLIEAAVNMITKRRIGVLATSATVASLAYSKKILEVYPRAYVFEQACPAFVPMIETGQINTDEVRMLAKQYLTPLLKMGVEEIILGCSHYPLLEDILKEFLPSNVRLVDPAIGLAKQLARLNDMNDLSFSKTSLHKNTRFCVTSDPNSFSSRAMYWLKNLPDEVELVSLQTKACVF